MRWLSWKLDETQMSGYFWRIFLLLSIMYLMYGIPGPGEILYYIILIDFFYWFFQVRKKGSVG